MLGVFNEKYHDSKVEEENNTLFEGQKVENISFLQTGLIDVYLSTEDYEEDNLLENSYKLLSMEAHKSFVGLADLLYQGRYVFSYIFSKINDGENYKIMREKDVEFTEDNSESSCSKVYSSAYMVKSLYNGFIELRDFNDDLDKFISCTTAYYWFYKEIHNISRDPKNSMLLGGVKNYDQLKTHKTKMNYVFTPETFEEHENAGFTICIPSCVTFETDKIEYFQSLYDSEENAIAGFMTSNPYFPYYHCREAANTINQLKESFRNEFKRSKQLLSTVFSDTEDGLITELIRVFLEVKRSNMEASSVLDMIDYVTAKYKEAVNCFEEKYEISLKVNFNKLNMLLGSIRPSTSSGSITEVTSNEHIPSELAGSLDRILEFSNLSNDKAELIKMQIEIFKNLGSKDKFDLIPSENKSKFNAAFFEVYESVAKRVLNENVNDKTIDMFLVYGFMDSGLLTNQQIIGLYNLLDKYNNECNVYSAKRWLTKIYTKEKSPSVSELGIDYEQMMREKKGKAFSGNSRTDQESDSGDKRLSFEISNMFKTTHKLCYGQISTYFPVLHNDMLPNDISRIVVTTNSVNESLMNILNEDFSAFHREVFYSGDNVNLKKELVMKQIIPDIILTPVLGTKAMMWQEISGRSKTSPGRFIIPILTSEDLNNLVMKLTSSFRWELCRTIMGVRWNDLSYSSLTSEYADYIDCYKKNKNLSSEAKEKVKAQIQRHHNNLREIFSSDYESWIKYEAKGTRRINREARAILYKYCPLKRSIREELIKQPAFADIAAQFEFERRKFARELENRYLYYVKQGIPMEPELEENLRFYKEL